MLPMWSVAASGLPTTVQRVNCEHLQLQVFSMMDGGTCSFGACENNGMLLRLDADMKHLANGDSYDLHVVSCDSQQTLDACSGSQKTYSIKEVLRNGAGVGQHDAASRPAPCAGPRPGR